MPPPFARLEHLQQHFTASVCPVSDVCGDKGTSVAAMRGVFNRLVCTTGSQSWTALLALISNTQCHLLLLALSNSNESVVKVGRAPADTFLRNGGGPCRLWGSPKKPLTSRNGILQRTVLSRQRFPCLDDPSPVESP